MKKLLIALLLIPQLAFADRAFYSAYSLVPGATAQGDLLFPAATQGIAIGVSTFDNAAQQIRLYNGASGAIKPTNMQLEIETAANGGMNISNATAFLSGYYFSNPSASYDGGMDYTNTPRTLNFRTATLTRWSINNSGALVQDATNGAHILLQTTNHGLLDGVTSYPADVTAALGTGPTLLSVKNVSTDASNAALMSIGAVTNAAELAFMKSRQTNGSADTIVNNADDVGALSFFGADGVTFRRTAFISASIDGVPGVADMPGRLVLATTTDGAASPTTALTINNAQAATFTQQVTSSRATDLGWAVVDGTNNTACNTQCTSAAVFGFALTGDTAFPIINFVGPADATADICLCAGAS